MAGLTDADGVVMRLVWTAGLLFGGIPLPALPSPGARDEAS